MGRACLRETTTRNKRFPWYLSNVSCILISDSFKSSRTASFKLGHTLPFDFMQLNCIYFVNCIYSRAPCHMAKQKQFRFLISSYSLVYIIL